MNIDLLQFYFLLSSEKIDKIKINIMSFSAPTAIGSLYLITTPLLLPVLGFIGVAIRDISQSKKEAVLNSVFVLLMFALLVGSLFGLVTILSPLDPLTISFIFVIFTFILHLLLLFVSSPKILPVIIATLTFSLFFSMFVVTYYNVIHLIPLAVIVYSIGYLLPQSSFDKIRIHQAAGLAFLMIPFLNFSFFSYRFFQDPSLNWSANGVHTVEVAFIPLGILFLVALIFLFLPHIKQSLYHISSFENIILGGSLVITALFLLITSIYLKLTEFTPYPCPEVEERCNLPLSEPPLISEFLIPYFLVFTNIMAIVLPLNMISRGIQNGEAWMRNLGIGFFSILFLGHVSFVMTDVITSTAIVPSALVTGVTGIVIISAIYYGNTHHWLRIKRTS
ncbi:MAG: hypothetical protein ABEI13_04305 [Candidatus Paceibacteria bacterium]